MDNKPNTSLIPFDMVLDTDFAILKLIQFKYAKDTNRHIFCEGFMTMTSPKYNHALEEMLEYRSFPNPVSCPMKSEYAPIYADKIYNNLVKNHYDNILALAHRTALFDTIIRSIKFNDRSLKFVVCCDNQDEKDAILNEFKKEDVEVRCILYPDIRPNLFETVNSIYIKQFADLSKYPKINGKNIIVADYVFNLEKGDKSAYVLSVKDTTKYYTNKFHIASIYNPDNFDAVG